MEMEFFMVLGLVLLLALGLALIGVPVLLRRTQRLQRDVALLQERLTILSAQNRASESDRPSSASVADSDSDSVTVPRNVPPQQNVDDIESSEQGYFAQDERQQFEPAAETAEPRAGWLDVLVQRFGQVNLTARVGSVVLIFGAVFLGKYASDIGLLTLQAKLWLMALVSLSMVAAGIYFNRRLQQYGAVLQATGLAGWLITLFAAHILYDQIHWLTALLAGSAGVTLIGYRALRQDSQLLACLAYLGGFLTPFIASSEASSLWRLFGFICLLNLAVALTAARKPWRWLVREAYLSSLLMLSALMLAEYLQRDLQQWAIRWPMLTFAAASVMIFSLLASHWFRHLPTQFRAHLSGLLFGVPAATVTALIVILRGEALYTAIALGLLAFWYGALAIWRRNLLLAAIAVVVASVAVPFAVNDGLTSLVYSIEGALFVIWGLRYQHYGRIGWGTFVQLAAVVFAFRLFTDVEVRTEQLWLSWWLYGAVLIAALICARISLLSLQDRWQRWLERGFLLLALLVWLYQWSFWLAQTLSRTDFLYSLPWLLAVTLGLCLGVSFRRLWPTFSAATDLLLPAYLIALMLYLDQAVRQASPLQLYGLAMLSLLVWLAAGWRSHRQRRSPTALASAYWFGLPGLTGLALYYAPVSLTDWNYSLTLLWPLLILWFLPSLLRIGFAGSQSRLLVRRLTLACVVLLLALTALKFGNYAPMRFWPLLHPMSLLAAVGVAGLYRIVRRAKGQRIALLIGSGVLVTMELNRWMFHFAGVPYETYTWFDSALTQTVWSLVWAVIGSSCMLTGARWRRSRSLWLTGAAAIGIVVIKLFVLDLSQVDTLYRILSFIGVGALLMAVGYFAPMPKARAEFNG